MYMRMYDYGACMTERSNVFIGMLLVLSWNISLKKYSHGPCTPNP
jgi:hypothetical protein